MWIQHYLEQYIMPFLNPTCNMDVNYRGKHKHKSSKILKKIKNKPLKNLKYKESTQNKQTQHHLHHSLT